MLSDLDLKIIRAEWMAEECRKKAEKFKANGEALRRYYKKVVLNRVGKRILLGHRINDLVDRELAANPHWGSCVSNNQWYIKQALMYSNEATMFRLQKLMSDNSDKKLPELRY